MTDYFLEINTLQCRLKAAHAQLESFRSGDAYRELQELRKADQRSYSRRITELEAEVSQAHAETVSVRNQWFDVFEDVEKEHQKELSLLEKRVSAMEQRALKAERERDEALGQRGMRHTGFIGFHGAKRRKIRAWYYQRNENQDRA